MSETAGISSSAARATRSGIRHAPSRIEYSEWTWRWTNGADEEAEGMRRDSDSDARRAPRPLGLAGMSWNSTRACSATSAASRSSTAAAMSSSGSARVDIVEGGAASRGRLGACPHEGGDDGHVQPVHARAGAMRLR